MEGNFSTSTYNRKSGKVVKKTVRWIFIKIVQYLFDQEKKISSTYNRNLEYSKVSNNWSCPNNRVGENFFQLLINM